MEITVNLLEVASELAHEMVCARFDDDQSAIYVSVTDAISYYTDDAQDYFNEWYDHYYDFILNLKTN